HRNAILTPEKGDTAMDTATDTATLEPTTRSLPLTEQAELRLKAAKEARNAALRARDYSRSNVALDYAVRETESEVRKAQAWVDQTTRSRDALRAAIPEAQRALVVAQSQLQATEQTARQMLTRARRQVEEAQADWDRLKHDLQQVAGEAVL